MDGFFFFKQKTAYEMRISDWSSDVCSSDLDAIGRKILQELSRDGRISNLELADRVGLSQSACLRRVQELERSGVIKGYRAVIDPAKLGLTFLAYVTVGLSSHTKKSQAGFEAAMAEAPEVRDCHHITGTIEDLRSEELTSELQSLMRISYAVF